MNQPIPQFPSYRPTATDLETFRQITHLWQTPSSRERLDALHTGSWQIQMAALLAIAHHNETEHIPVIHRLLCHQDTLPLYAAPDENTLDPAPSAHIRECWRCRFRVKQYALLALDLLLASNPELKLPDDLLALCRRYATDPNEDYPVRAAACSVLLHFPECPACQATLRLATSDSEWCTATVASRAFTPAADSTAADSSETLRTE